MNTTDLALRICTGAWELRQHAESTLPAPVLRKMLANLGAIAAFSRGQNPSIAKGTLYAGAKALCSAKVDVLGCLSFEKDPPRFTTTEGLKLLVEHEDGTAHLRVQRFCGQSSTDKDTYLLDDARWLAEVLA